MSQRTATNAPYKGLLEAKAIPAQLVEGGRPYAVSRGARPIHCCTPDEVAKYAESTHHYCGIFAEELFAPLEELALVRIDDATAEKVFINRSRRILVTSSDGRIAQWRAAPTFESGNRFVAGTPIDSRSGAPLSVVTARHGNYYAVSCFEGDGGYFETSEPWTIKQLPAEGLVYGDQILPSREALRAHVASLPPAQGEFAARPVLWAGSNGARIALVGAGGRQIAHFYLHGVTAQGVEYL